MDEGMEKWFKLVSQNTNPCEKWYRVYPMIIDQHIPVSILLLNHCLLFFLCISFKSLYVFN